MVHWWWGLGSHNPGNWELGYYGSFILYNFRADTWGIGSPTTFSQEYLPEFSITVLPTTYGRLFRWFEEADDQRRLARTCIQPLVWSLYQPFLGCCECGKNLYQQKAHMVKIKKMFQKFYLANIIFIKRPLGNYIKGHRIHGGNEVYFFGYILWLLKPQIHLVSGYVH